MKRFLLLMTIVVGGCKLGPEYRRPDPPVPVESGRMASEEQLGRWWRNFNDPVLSEIIETGLTNSPTVQLAYQRVRQSRAQLKQGQSGLFPTLTGASSYNYGRKFGETGGIGYSATGSGIAGEWGGTFAGGFDAAWELDAFGGVRREIEAREAEFEGMNYLMRDAEVSLAAEIATGYFNVRMIQNVLGVTRSNLVTQTQSAEITRKRYRAKFVSGLDLANAEAQVSSTTAQLPVLESELADAVLRLEFLMGEVPGARREKLLGTETLPVLPEIVPELLSNELLRRRADVRHAETALQAATARIGVAKADLWPKFSLIGSVGVSSPDVVAWDNWTESFRVGPSMKWNFFNAGRVRAQIEEREILAEQAVSTYRQTVLSAYSEAASALQGFRQETDRRAALSASVESNRKAARIAHELYKAGFSDYTEVLIAQRSLLIAQDLFARHEALLGQKLIALYKALGGGWCGPEKTGETK